MGIPLSFTKEFGDGQTNFWSPERTGDYMADCAVGRAAGLEIVERLRDGAAPNLLGSVIRDMIASDQFEGVEAGFCSTIAQIVARG